MREAVRDADLDPPADVHASADYRRHLAQVLAARAGRERSVSDHTISVTINGEVYEQEVEARKLLVHFIRDDLDLTGTHIGCDTGNCGACTVLVDGKAVKSCMLLAVQADGPRSRPSRAWPATSGELTPLQQAFPSTTRSSAATAPRGCSSARPTCSSTPRSRPRRRSAARSRATSAAAPAT